MRIFDGQPFMQFLIGAGARAAPVVVSMSPAFGSTAGDTVPHVLTGTGFSGASAVTIGGAAATFVVDSDTQITLTALPARTAGTHDVAVTRGGQTGTLSSGYRAVDVAAWYRADLGRTMNGATVSGWADQSGNARHVSQGTASSQPTYEATGLNSAPALYFDGGDSLSSQNTFVFPATFEMYIVQKTTAGSRPYVFWDDGESRAKRYLYNSSPNAFYEQDGIALRSMRNATSFTAHPAGARVLGHRFEGTHASHVISNNGVDYTMSDVTNENPTANSPTGTLTLFSFRGTSEWVTGRLREVIIIGEVLGSTPRADVIAYLKAGGGIA